MTQYNLLEQECLIIILESGQCSSPVWLNGSVYLEYRIVHMPSI